MNNGMLNYLKLENVGPSPKLEIDFKPRMNFLTGDNGLGKTFLLDIAWWVLTRTWARSAVTPPRKRQGPPRSRFLMLRYLTRSAGNWYWQKWRDSAQRPDH
jgi:hypothetical protein